MCGIAGCINKSDLSKEDLRNLMGQMSESLKHRGPDGCGQWIDKFDRAAFSHSRLAILDLSSAAPASRPISNKRRYVALAHEFLRWPFRYHPCLPEIHKLFLAAHPLP